MYLIFEYSIEADIIVAELESEVEKYRENDNEERRESPMKGMNGLTKATNYVKNVYIREGSNVSNVHPKKPLSGISYFIVMSSILQIYPFKILSSSGSFLTSSPG